MGLGIQKDIGKDVAELSVLLVGLCYNDREIF